MKLSTGGPALSSKQSKPPPLLPPKQPPPPPISPQQGTPRHFSDRYPSGPCELCCAISRTHSFLHVIPTTPDV
ncbi:hypothetical protein L211DRAFT_662287 [Terfezia boudieri ATCC MYA-4762]|uniref:Uncharacterized protein n=1 Tax=Terfezia boudieri ATCC MYA-4762 TaxID=1051890 RepID=A0A3N4LMK0_9PEZI|nr:hypothetical protein L211DRAFT_662287 [Terfezia boudieri ATCC MYA-4762]